MVQVNLNSAGKLRWFSAIPAADAAPLADPVDPGAVFRAAGLDKANFTETAPKFAPLGAADQLLAWVAAWLLHGGPTLNKPTHFEARDGRF